jgi:hypothetical protein
MAITYEPIASTTLSSANASTEFTSISGSYTDIVLIVNGGLTTNNQSFFFQFNSDSSSLYSYTYLAGSGSAASASRVTPTTGIAAYNVNGQSDDQIKSQVILQLQNYSNTTTFKTCLVRGGTDLTTQATVGLYRSTSAITAVKILATNGTLQTGSTFTLYGIKAA